MSDSSFSRERRSVVQHETPVDELTGMPLPLLNPLSNEYPRTSNNPNWHHAFHPAKSSILTRDMGGKALRACRVQKVNYKMHGDYHKQYVGPPLTEDVDEQFRMVVLATAGYMPDQALTLHADGRPRVVRIDQFDREYLWQNSQLKVWSTDIVRVFLRDYLLAQDFSQVKNSLLDEFLHTANPDRRFELGNNFLGIAANQATEHVKDTYKEANKSLLLPPGRSERASRFVLGALGLRRNRANTFTALGRQIATYG